MTPERTLDAVDVVIVGSGAAGARFAAVLAGAGKSVLVLEGGPARSLDQLTSSQLYARRLKWGGPPVDQTGTDRFPFNLNSGWGVGGAALHHYATWPRLHEEDFRMASLYGRGIDWPFDYAELRPWYDRVQAEVGLSGDTAGEVWRPPSDPYPLSPLPTFAQGDVIARGFEALGLRTAPTPAAILTEPYNGREPCLQDGWCDSGCPIGALWNPLIGDLKTARAAGARVQPDSFVTRVVMDRADRASGVEIREADGRVTMQRAGLVVLCGGAVENPRILLSSQDQWHPAGLGNAHDQVGRHFMVHTMALVFGLFAEETDCWQGVNCGQRTSRDGYRKDMRPRAFGSYQWQIAPAAKPNDIFGIAIARSEVFGAALHAFMADAARHFGSMGALGEALPEPDNRVTLATTADAKGRPRASIAHRFDADALALWQHSRDEGERVFKAAGARDIWFGPLAPGHMIGGTRMGTDPRTSVTDPFGRLHGVENVYLGGSGLFPTSAGVNPTYTITALAARTAAQIVGQQTTTAQTTLSP
jgi:choline dehydrogenase-like flavoprotein